MKYAIYLITVDKDSRETREQLASLDDKNTATLVAAQLWCTLIKFYGFDRNANWYIRVFDTHTLKTVSVIGRYKS